MPSLISEKSKLSRDGNHLVSRLEVGRDNMVLATVSAGALAGMGAHSVVEQMGTMSLAAAVVGAVAAGYVAARSYISLRAMDKKLSGLAELSEQEAPHKGAIGLMPVSEVLRIVKAADPVFPDMVKSIAERRERRWEAALAQDYRPPKRPGQPGA
jgi:hypothetical protein